MKTLVVYTTISGKSKAIAEKISAILQADVEKIDDKRNRKGIFGFIRSGYEAKTKKLPPIGVPKKKTSAYDQVVFVCPIWAGTFASPVRTYCTNYCQKMKSVALFVTRGAKENPFAGASADLETLTGKKVKAFGSISASADEQSLTEEIDEFTKKLL